VRVSSVPLGGSGGGSWAIVPGIATEVQPALVGSPAGRLELYVTTSAGTVVRAVLGAPGSRPPPTRPTATPTFSCSAPRPACRSSSSPARTCTAP
jgi:hypothetical protein